MLQWGRFLPFLFNENPLIKESGGVLSLVNSVLKESKIMGAKTIEDITVDKRLSLLSKKIKKNYQLMVQQ